MHHAMRIEEDNLGQITLPSTCLWGIHTQRAIDNFPISGIKLNLFPEFIRSLAWVKTAAARANRSLGVLSGEKAGDRRGLRRYRRGPLSRRFPRGHDPGGRGHLDQYERQ